jgi:hypothetical protein
MALLSPLILVLIFGSMLLTRPAPVPEPARPFMAFGAMAMILVTMIGIVGNQFGFDRSGFRVFVLCAAPRRDILLGKNLAVAPLALGLGTVVTGLLQAVYPMRVDYFLAVLPQLLTMYLLYCMLANVLSIIAPMPIAPGSLKPANPKPIPVLLNIAFVFLFPVVVLPSLLPLGIAILLDRLGWVHGFPFCLILSVVECVAMVFLYRLVITWEGWWLQAREQKILEIVAEKGQ